MASSSNNRLLAPIITVDTSSTVSRSAATSQQSLLRDEQYSQDFAASDVDSINPSPSRERFSRDGGSFLAVASPSSPTAGSLDGETLRSRANSFNTDARSRAGSFNSSADTYRSRANTASSSRPTLELQSPEEALKPNNKNDEPDFVVENNPFAYTSGQLNKLLNPKSLSAYKALGGLQGLERGLRTDAFAGLSVDETRLDGKISFEEASNATGAKSLEDRPVAPQETTVTAHEVKGQFEDRLRVFKDNRLPEKKSKSFWALLWQAYNDKILILLTIAAVVSLALGLYEALGQSHPPGEPSLDWVEGVAICVAIIVVTLATALNDLQRERQFVKLNKKVRSPAPLGSPCLRFSTNDIS